MAENFKTDETLATRLNDKLTAVRKPLLAALAAVIIALVVLVVAILVSEQSTKKGLAHIDAIYFSLTSKEYGSEAVATSADGEETTVEDQYLSNTKSLAEAESISLEALIPYAAKGGIVGVRANLLMAELYFEQKDFEKARAAWLKAATAKNGAYTAPLAYFNAAVCSENVGDNEQAAQYYKTAADAKDFLLADHALFSLGRVQEALSDVAAAQEAYEKLCDVHPDTTWAHLAKSRLLSLQASGAID